MANYAKKNFWKALLPKNPIQRCLLEQSWNEKKSSEPKERNMSAHNTLLLSTSAKKTSNLWRNMQLSKEIRRIRQGDWIVNTRMLQAFHPFAQGIKLIFLVSNVVSIPKIQSSSKILTRYLNQLIMLTLKCCARWVTRGLLSKIVNNWIWVQMTWAHSDNQRRKWDQRQLQLPCRNRLHKNYNSTRRECLWNHLETQISWINHSKEDRQKTS